jgi:hypothetical protein
MGPAGRHDAPTRTGEDKRLTWRCHTNRPGKLCRLGGSRRVKLSPVARCLRFISRNDNVRGMAAVIGIGAVGVAAAIATVALTRTLGRQELQQTTR